MARKKKNNLLKLLVLLTVLVAGTFGIMISMYARDYVPPSQILAEHSIVLPAPLPEEELILVNKTHVLDKDYVPETLVSVKYAAEDRDPESQKMVPEAAYAFNTLAEAALAEGHTIKVTTAYRTYEYQEELYNNYLNTRGSAWTEVYSAKPGASEHQTGYAADVSSPDMDYKLRTKFGSSPEGLWLAENAHRFGFIIRYPENKTDITGYMAEPWHIRYVGIDAATEIYEKDLTLEEYLGAVE